MSNAVRFRLTYLWILSLFFVIMILAASGCVVRFITDYDEQVDKSVTELHRKVETLLVKIESNINQPEGSYDKLKPLYEEIKVDIGAIDVRVSAKPKNEQTIEQLELLRENIHALEEIHMIGIGDRDVVIILRKQFKSAFVSILTLELGKKRGE